MKQSPAATRILIVEDNPGDDFCGSPLGTRPKKNRGSVPIYPGNPGHGGKHPPGYGRKYRPGRGTGNIGRPQPRLIKIFLMKIVADTIINNNE